MLKGVRAEFYAASSREPEIYRGRPFQIEAAIAFGGELPTEESSRVIRFANRVPLLFQQSACSSFKAVAETGWKNYGLTQPRGSTPTGPLVILIHMASVWVPFTSESKEAIADYDEIRKEMRLALMECGRKLGTYLRKRLKMRREGERRDVFERYIGEIAKALNAITGEDAKRIYEALLAQARSRTAVADQQLDEDGKIAKDDEDNDDEGVIIVMNAIAPIEESQPILAPNFDAPVASGARESTRKTPRKNVKPSAKDAKSAPVKVEKTAAKPPKNAIVTKRDLAARAPTSTPGHTPAVTPASTRAPSRPLRKPDSDDDPRLF